MTIVEWAEVALPLLALGWVLCLVAIYPDAINAIAAKVCGWWTTSPQTRRRTQRSP
jgi:hypothetical protein